jgi:hypothetical protein
LESTKGAWKLSTPMSAPGRKLPSTDRLLGIRSLGEAPKGLLRDLSRVVLKQYVTDAIVAALPNIPTKAQGGKLDSFVSSDRAAVLKLPSHYFYRGRRAFWPPPAPPGRPPAQTPEGYHAKKCRPFADPKITS